MIRFIVTSIINNRDIKDNDKKEPEYRTINANEYWKTIQNNSALTVNTYCPQLTCIHNAIRTIAGSYFTVD